MPPNNPALEDTTPASQPHPQPQTAPSPLQTNPSHHHLSTIIHSLLPSKVPVQSSPSPIDLPTRTHSRFLNRHHSMPVSENIRQRQLELLKRNDDDIDGGYSSSEVASGSRLGTAVSPAAIKSLIMGITTNDNNNSSFTSFSSTVENSARPSIASTPGLNITSETTASTTPTLNLRPAVKTSEEGEDGGLKEVAKRLRDWKRWGSNEGNPECGEESPRVCSSPHRSSSPGLLEALKDLETSPTSQDANSFEENHRLTGSGEGAIEDSHATASISASASDSSDSLFDILPRDPSLHKGNGLDDLSGSSCDAGHEKEESSDIEEVFILAPERQGKEQPLVEQVPLLDRPFPESPVLGQVALQSLRIADPGPSSQVKEPATFAPTPTIATKSKATSRYSRNGVPKYREPIVRPAFPSTINCAGDGRRARAVLPGMSIPLSEIRQEADGKLVLSHELRVLLSKRMVSEKTQAPSPKIYVNDIALEQIPEMVESMGPPKGEDTKIPKVLKDKKRKLGLFKLTSWLKYKVVGSKLRVSDEDDRQPAAQTTSKPVQRFRRTSISRYGLSESEAHAKYIIDKWGYSPLPSSGPQEHGVGFHKETDAAIQFGTRKNRIPCLSRIVIAGEGPRFEFPEAIVVAADVDFDFFSYEVSIAASTARQLLEKASLWIPGDHPIVKDFEALSSLPNHDGSPVEYAEDDAVEEEEGQLLNKDIDLLQQHIRLGRWIWILGFHGTINVQRTAVLHEARAQCFEERNEGPLKRLCKNEPAFLDLTLQNQASDLLDMIRDSENAAFQEEERVMRGDCSDFDVEMIDAFVEKGFLSFAIEKAMRRRDEKIKRETALIERELMREEWSIAKKLWESVHNHKTEAKDRMLVKRRKTAVGLSRREWRESQRQRLLQGIVEEDLLTVPIKPVKSRIVSLAPSPDPKSLVIAPTTAPRRRSKKDKGKMKEVASSASKGIQDAPAEAATEESTPSGPSGPRVHKHTTRCKPYCQIKEEKTEEWKIHFCEESCAAPCPLRPPPKILRLWNMYHQSAPPDNSILYPRYESALAEHQPPKWYYEVPTMFYPAPMHVRETTTIDYRYHNQRRPGATTKPPLRLEVKTELLKQRSMTTSGSMIMVPKRAIPKEVVSNPIRKTLYQASDRLKRVRRQERPFVVGPISTSGFEKMEARSPII